MILGLRPFCYNRTQKYGTVVFWFEKIMLTTGSTDPNAQEYAFVRPQSKMIMVLCTQNMALNYQLCNQLQIASVTPKLDR